MKYHLKLNGKHTHDVSSANPDADEIPKGWGYVTEGWRTEQQVLDLGLSIKGRQSREVIDEEAREILVENEPKELDENGITLTHAETLPARTHLEYWVDKNYTIEVEDETLTPEYKAGQRRKEYEKLGVTTDAMVVALWEKQVENRPEAADALQAKRLTVKQKFPKN